MQILLAAVDVLRRLAKDFGPYVMLEVLLPGGTLFALLLFVYRRGGLRQDIVLPVTRACAAFLSAPYHRFSSRMPRPRVSPGCALSVPCKTETGGRLARLRID